MNLLISKKLNYMHFSTSISGLDTEGKSCVVVIFHVMQLLIRGADFDPVHRPARVQNFPGHARVHPVVNFIVILHHLFLKESFYNSH